MHIYDATTLNYLGVVTPAQTHLKYYSSQCNGRYAITIMHLRDPKRTGRLTSEIAVMDIVTKKQNVLFCGDNPKDGAVLSEGILVTWSSLSQVQNLNVFRF
jgi:hypothetical protein